MTARPAQNPEDDEVEEFKFYETPEGVAVRKGDQTVYANVDVARDCESLVAFRIVKRMPGGKCFTMVFELDPEMTKIFSQRAYEVAKQIEDKSE